jgi:hypothetical protein
MHNKRIGRDDILKIEVRHTCGASCMIRVLTRCSGPARLHLLHGALSAVDVRIVTAVVVVAPLAVGRLARAVAPATTPHARTIVVTATVTTTVIAVTLATALAALILGKVLPGRP